MRRIIKAYYDLTREPHRNAVLIAMLLVIVLCFSLLTGFLFPPAWTPLLAFALIVVVLLQAFTIVLIARMRAKLNDTHYAVSLDSGLSRAGYCLRDFFTDAAAANPSLQLHNLKILRFFRPQKVLELGSGQTTKLLSGYAKENPSAFVLTLEQDETWVRLLKEHVIHDYRSVPLVGKDFICRGSGRHISTTWYADMAELRDHRFDYILVDGPDHGNLGTEHTDYSRSGLLEYMPGLLADSFVVMFDDAERYGEIMTIRALKELLAACGVPHLCFSIHGVKTQVVFCSPDLSYLRSI